MDFKLLGSILLIAGTTIGGGMLALPIATAELGFIGSVILLIICWAIMTSGALLILEVNLWLPQTSNLISMAKTTLGPLGQMVAWVVNLLLLYSLLCAYIAGGSDLFHDFFGDQQVHFPLWLGAVIFTTIFGLIVFAGMRTVDYVNRGLMIFKLGAYVCLVVLLLPLTSTPHLLSGNLAKLTSTVAITVTITSFGYAVIVPSLRVYFAGDVKKLKTAIIIGGLIPLICYIAWDAAIMGVIPLGGKDGLIQIMQSKTSTSHFVDVLTERAAKDSITLFAKLFTSVCVLTSLLGVGLCLCDVLADGLQVEKKGFGAVFINLITFVPPLIVVLFFPNAFIYGLKYAGIYSLILLVLLPAAMAWRGRYHKQIAHGFRVIGGKLLLSFLIIFSLVLIVYGFKG